MKQRSMFLKCIAAVTLIVTIFAASELCAAPTHVTATNSAAVNALSWVKVDMVGFFTRGLMIMFY